MIPKSGPALSLGRYDTAIVRAATGGATISYSQGGTCPNQAGSIQSQITFTCDPKATNTLPAYVGSLPVTAGHCGYAFTWTTCYACPGGCEGEFTTNHNIPSNGPTKSPGPSPNSSSTSAGKAVGITFAVVLSVVLLVVLARDSTRRRVIGLFSKKPQKPAFQYKKVMAHLSISAEDDNDILIESDEDEDDTDSRTGHTKETLLALP